MLHKLLKRRRLGHLKVGARTLITAELVGSPAAADPDTAARTEGTELARVHMQLGRWSRFTPPCDECRHGDGRPVRSTG
jgi:hypothetical protein